MMQSLVFYVQIASVTFHDNIYTKLFLVGVKNNLTMWTIPEQASPAERIFALILQAITPCENSGLATRHYSGYYNGVFDI